MCEEQHVPIKDVLRQLPTKLALALRDLLPYRWRPRGLNASIVGVKMTSVDAYGQAARWQLYLQYFT